MTFNELRIKIQDELALLFKSDIPEVGVYFDGAKRKNLPIPYVFVRLDFGEIKQKSIGADINIFRGTGILVFTVKCDQNTKNITYDNIIGAINKFHSGEYLRGFATPRTLRSHPRLYSDGVDTTILTLTFQYDMYI